MSARNRDLLEFYQASRIDDQLRFYSSRREQFDQATGQGLAISAVFLGLTSAAAALAGTALGSAHVWAALAAILPAMSTALAAYVALYAFEQQSKVYGDAERAVRAVSRTMPDPEAAHDGRTPEENIADMVTRVEGTLRGEHAQWGQLTSQVQISDQTKK